MSDFDVLACKGKYNKFLKYNLNACDKKLKYDILYTSLLP